MMWNVRELLQERGWAGVAREFYREVKAFHLMLLQEVPRSAMGVRIPPGLYRLIESVASSPQSPLLRAQARLKKKLPVVQARLVDSDDLGAKDASQSIARLVDADDVPLDAFKSDLKRKVALDPSRGRRPGVPSCRQP